MRVLVLHSRYLSGPASGENRVVEDEIELLRAGGHDVVTWTPSVAAGSGLLATGIGAVWNHEATRTIRGLIHTHRIDVVHFHNLFPALSPASLRVVRSAGIPSIVTLHNYRLLCLPSTFLRDGKPCQDCLGHLPWRGVVHRCYRGSLPGSASMASSLALHRLTGTFEGVTRYLAVSEFVRQKHIEAGFSPRQIIVKPNFSWPMTRRRGTGDYFLFMGRLSEEKGLATIVGSWPERGPRLLVVGDGPEAEALRADASANVEFVGLVSGDAIPGFLARAKALVAPSKCFEGAPRAIIEAYAAGVPVLASDVGALPEAVQQDRTGLILPARDPRAWREGARRLSDDELNLRLGDGAYAAWQERFSPEAALARLEEIYSSVEP